MTHGEKTASAHDRGREIHIVSHGPHCLDGVSAAVAVARFHAGAKVAVEFTEPSESDRVLRAFSPANPNDYALWITDISWRDEETDAHLRALVERGLRIYWLDHHRTALKRARERVIDVPFADCVLSEEFAASRLVYEYLCRRPLPATSAGSSFKDLARLIQMADDNDRWIHQIDGSRALGLVVSALGPDSYEELLRIGPDVSFTPRMEAVHARVQARMRRSFAVAEASRTARRLPDGTTLVAAACAGYASEIADRWGQRTTRTVFALYDASTLAVSLRRSPDSDIDLSRVAEHLGGGGHAAAAGCELPDLLRILARAVADALGTALRDVPSAGGRESGV